MANVLESQHPLVKQKLTMLRQTSTDPKIFRELVREITLLLVYEATQDLALEPTTVTTPLGPADGYTILEKVGLVPILRSGLGMVDGVWEMMPGAEVWHLGLYRDEETLLPVAYYNKLPVEPTVQICLVLDPMLATGGSAVAAVSTLKSWGVDRIKFIGILAAPEGIEALQSAHPTVDIYVAKVDSHLNDVGFIVPGLGDAGDRQFGTA
ncbi:MAG TPA: uracil phosphoribosyltransferase [candidate division Zixibacteria bacterium]|nr:uracil phosphoribosyltransferase [candidate division Zixibacteria bacterium]